MKHWLNQYKLDVSKTRLISLAGVLVVFGLLIRELYAVYIDIALYEQPSLPNEIWWEVFFDVTIATSIATVLGVRLFLLYRYGYSLIVFSLTVLAMVGFILYAYLTPAASSDSICDSAGRCFGFYVLERQDWVQAAAILFFPATLLRSAITAMVAFLASKSRFE